jgi:hypothetical protein
MATSLRILDAADLLKMLTQSTADTTPDNPAEQLSDFVAAPPAGTESIAVTDTASLPNPNVTPPYTYGQAIAYYGVAQWG